MAPQVLPAVPPADYMDSIRGDYRWAQDYIAENPVYLILNACRVWAYLRAGLIYSKEEGATWALNHLPKHLGGLVEWAQAIYRGESDDDRLSVMVLAPFLDYMDRQLQA